MEGNGASSLFLTHSLADVVVGGHPVGIERELGQIAFVGDVSQHIFLVGVVESRMGKADGLEKVDDSSTVFLGRHRQTALEQVDELEQADFYVGEYEELTEKKRMIENREKISFALNC